MKKRYEKPIVLMENFELSDYVAACNIDVEVTFANGGPGCTFSASGDLAGEVESFWQSGAFTDVNACRIQPDEICYHNASNGWLGVFTS